MCLGGAAECPHHTYLYFSNVTPDRVKHHVMKAIDFLFENDQLPKSQSLGLISIIPKGEKEKKLPSNWRNFGSLAERIRPALVILFIMISKHQHFLPGIYFGAVIRTTYEEIS